ncbi:hypothetical protein CVT24_004669 [Panaeolus cyanescens]|uniref:Uncharacterized protein n=1 Tax=Panaeolus cyanescens TaxID=181874 RepID=A0A409X7M3_9AGAR|nr:hypothetical protein CVT24_004669 [Panaeolus cyanescens]
MSDYYQDNQDDVMQYHGDERAQWLRVEECQVGDVVWGRSMDCWFAKNGEWVMRDDANDRVHPMIVIGVNGDFCEVLVCSHDLPDDLDADSKVTRLYTWDGVGDFDDTVEDEYGDVVSKPTCVALGVSFHINIECTRRKVWRSLPLRLGKEGLEKLFKDVVECREGLWA